MTLPVHRLLRETPNGQIFGKYYIEGEYFCETLEPNSPMPSGEYLVRLRYSPSHGYAVFGLLDVPGHNDIEIHSGNTRLDTKDCILQGSERGTLKTVAGVLPAVLSSRETIKAFMTRCGVPGFKSLFSWDDVREFLVAHPECEGFRLEIINA